MLKLTGLTLAIIGAFLVGCSKSDSGGTKATSDSGSHRMSGEHGMAGSGAAAVLPPGANRTCPVMGEEVDPAIHTEYKGKKVYFCCDQCLKKFEKDPDRYFSKAYPDARDR